MPTPAEIALRQDRMGDPKKRPHNALYLRILRAMTPEQRLAKAFELGEMGRELLRAGLRQRNTKDCEDVLHARELEQIARCHNRNY
jgi:hypothetical protein